MTCNHSLELLSKAEMQSCNYTMYIFPPLYKCEYCRKIFRWDCKKEKLVEVEIEEKRGGKT